MNPLLSVHIATYNQKDFINQAVQSALAQETSFSVEIVIGDDYSTDGTREILNGLKAKYPDRLVLNLLPAKGKGMIGQENYETTIEKCRGKYIAFLDGDDFWTDKDKLTKQVNFLENNSEYVMSHHDCAANETEGVLLKKKFNKSKPKTGFYDACQITIPFMSSVVIRKDAINFYSRRSFLSDLDLGDFALWIMASLKGKFYYFDEAMAYYRVNTESVSKTLGYEVQVKNRMMFAEKLLKSEYNFDRKFIYKFVSRYYFQFSGISLSKRQFGKTFKYLFKSLLYLVLGISLKKKNYSWISRLKWTKLFQLYAANIPAALKTN